MAIVSKSGAEWKGGIKTGNGTMKGARGPSVPYSLGSRFEGQPSSSPEELLGSALAGCFSMALTLALESQGLAPRAVRTDAEVSLDKDGAGFTITGIALKTTADVPGVDDAKFQAIAEETKKGCPVSKVLAATRITLSASLAT